MTTIKKIAPKSLAELSAHIKTHAPTFYSSSRTSTVIAYEKLEADDAEYLKAMGEQTTWVDLSNMPGSIEVDGELVTVSGHVSWSELRATLNSKGLDIMTSPTESLASVLAGLATSATGERSFGYGTLRDQVVSAQYLDYQGELKVLSSERAFPKTAGLAEYQAQYAPYEKFKNAPFPRATLETDLMIGTEGQLGVLTRATLKTIKLVPLTYLFFKLPRWNEDFSAHLELFHAVADMRDKLGAVELIDSHSLSYLPTEQNPAPGCDLIFIEMKSSDFEEVYAQLESRLPKLDFEDVFAMDESKCRALRVAVPRSIFEANTRAGVTKKGTDVQVSPAKFKDLLAHYQQWSKGDIEYNLFGHFGDAHLHFNFMPAPARAAECDQKLEELYRVVHRLGGSPFAEHGIGILKQRYIKEFYTDACKDFFRALKAQHDPHNQFFPLGFMHRYK